MKSYSQALRDWFYARAFIPSYYGGGSYPEEEKTAKFRKHVKKCGLVWVTEPDVGSVRGFAGTFAEDDDVPGIKALLACNCDEYEKKYEKRTFFVPGRVTLGEMIQQVIAEGEKR